MAESRRASKLRTIAGVVFAFYASALAVIAFWPTPVDRGAGRLLSAITRRIPFLTYDVIEFTANIALFVPFGVLLALLLSGRSRWLVLPIAMAVTLTIEAGQAVFLAERTASIGDVVANASGVLVGLGAVLLGEQREELTRNGPSSMW